MTEEQLGGGARRGLRKGLRVLITGAGGGIGLEIATACHAEGARVHICDVNEALLGPLSALPADIGRTLASTKTLTVCSRQ